MRTPPIRPPERVWQKRVVEDVRTYRFLTWVFGGGVKVQEHQKFTDPVTPIRVASIRGQLRFWWRACNPGRCTTVTALREREGEIWGTTSRASRVAVEVVSPPPAPRPVQVYGYIEKNGKRNLVPNRGMEEIAYGAFPLQPSRDAQRRNEQPGTLFDYGESEFTVRFVYPQEIAEDVLAALWAWEAFGGLGGRTRRGFGAIARTRDSNAEDLKSEWDRFRQHPRIDHVPSLAGSRFELSGHSQEDPLRAWKEALGLLQRIRQGAGFGRKKPSDPKKRGGRSLWPEPDEIRRLTKMAAPRHRNPVVSVDRFPRAAFGMPIVFHFHPGSKEEPESQGDPKMKKALQLQPSDYDRFASPLVIRPVPDRGKYRAAGLALSSQPPKALLVTDEEKFMVRCDLDEKLAAGIPALNRGNQVFTDPIQLFLWELRQ